MRKGQRTPAEVRLKQSLAHRGSKNPMYGKKLSATHIEKLQKANTGNNNALGYTHTEEAKEKIKEASVGRKHTEKTKQRISRAHSEELSYLWKGDKVGYWGVHRWVYKNKGKAVACLMNDETCKGKFEWSNVSQEYKRDLDDWQQLCRSHHRRYDLARQK